MKAHTITLYELGELSPRARSRAIEDERQNIDSTYDYSDWVASLRGFESQFDCSVVGWEVSSYGSLCGRILVDADEEQSTLEWFQERMPDDLISGNCPWTGFFGDETLLDGLRGFVLSPQGETVLEVLQSCVQGWVDAWQSELEYRESDEGISEELSEREVFFFETGEVFPL